MKYYSHINLENLTAIQEKVFDLFPKNELSSKENLFYIPDNLKLFFNIPELKTELDKLNWSQYVHSFGFYVINKTSGTPIHVDTGTSLYSFNIPILNCQNTYVNFYKTDKQPIKKSYVAYNKIIDYYSFNPSDCSLQDRLEMTTPHVIKVKEVHNVTNINPLPRITLLIRLKNEINLDYIFQ